MREAQAPQTYNNEFDTYINGPIVEFASTWDCIPWLRGEKNPTPGIAQHALDLLCIPAMSAELERVFSQAKLTITPQRNRLSDTMIEVLELMHHWYTNNTITPPRGATGRSTRTE